MTANYTYLIRKFIALDRYSDFDTMATVYSKDDLFETYLTLKSMSHERLQRKQKMMQLSLDDFISFERVMGVIGENYTNSKKEDERPSANLQNPHSDNKPPSRSNQKTLTDYDKITPKQLTSEMLKDRYLVQNKSLQDIATEFNYTRQNIHHLMHKYGINRRSQSKARTVAIKQGKFGDLFHYDDINEDFFAEWSDGMAWLLGLLYTDGCLHKGKTSPRVSFDTMDRELIDKMRLLMNSTRRTLIRKQAYDKSKHIYTFNIHREKMIADLKKIGLVERKSLIMQFPSIPEKYVRHFIRGCWDGDGSIFISDNKLRASYTCGSLAFIERLVQELFKVGIYKTVMNKTLKYAEREKLRVQYPDRKYPITIHKKRDGNSYDIKFGDREQLDKFFHYLYDGVDEFMYLNRKYKKFVEGLEH